MKDFLKGIGILAGVAAIVAVGYVVVLVAVAMLPIIVVGVTHLLAAVAALALIVGVIVGIVYVAKEIGKACRK